VDQGGGQGRGDRPSGGEDLTETGSKKGRERGWRVGDEEERRGKGTHSTFGFFGSNMAAPISKKRKVRSDAERNGNDGRTVYGMNGQRRKVKDGRK